MPCYRRCTLQAADRDCASEAYDPDEIWFECPECEGTGKVNTPDEENVLAGGDPWAMVVEATCPDCDGAGFYEGAAPDDDIDETRWTDA